MGTLNHKIVSILAKIWALSTCIILKDFFQITEWVVLCNFVIFIFIYVKQHANAVHCMQCFSFTAFNSSLVYILFHITLQNFAKIIVLDFETTFPQRVTKLGITTSAQV